MRTYTMLRGKPGIWFFSLDAGSLAAVFGARLTYRLPYFKARMTIAPRARDPLPQPVRAGARFEAAYEPTGPARVPAPGTLEHWLTERYCLYTLLGGRVLRAEIHHPPWALQPATAAIGANTMAPGRAAVRRAAAAFRPPSGRPDLAAPTRLSARQGGPGRARAPRRRAAASARTRLRHPRLGELELRHVVLQAADEPDQTLVTFAPSLRDRERLAALLHRLAPDSS